MINFIGMLSIPVAVARPASSSKCFSAAPQTKTVASDENAEKSTDGEDNSLNSCSEVQLEASLSF